MQSFVVLEKTTHMLIIGSLHHWRTIASRARGA